MASTSGPKSGEPARRVAVWDLPTRLFHWTLVGLFLALWITGNGDMLGVHMIIGQVVMILILFRLGWGIVGSRHSRFADFVVGPRDGIAHLREMLSVARRGPAGASGEPHTGHTRLGGWMILLLLVLLAVQCVTGCFASDDIMVQGPLNHLVNSRTARILTVTHDLLFNFLLLFAGIHILAALFYLVRKRENLIVPLITGRTWLPEALAARESKFASYWLALALLIVACAIVWGITSL